MHVCVVALNHIRSESTAGQTSHSFKVIIRQVKWVPERIVVHVKVKICSLSHPYPEARVAWLGAHSQLLSASTLPHDFPVATGGVHE